MSVYIVIKHAESSVYYWIYRKLNKLKVKSITERQIDIYKLNQLERYSVN